MSISYENLWNLLSQKGLKRTDLCEKAGITTNTLAKLGKNESVQVEVLSKICGVLECSFDDIVKNTGDNAIISPFPNIDFSLFDFYVSEEFETLHINTLRDFPKPYTIKSIGKTLTKYIRECKLSLYSVEVFISELRNHHIEIKIDENILPDFNTLPTVFSSDEKDNPTYQIEVQQIQNYLEWKLNSYDIIKRLDVLSYDNTVINSYKNENSYTSATITDTKLIYNCSTTKTSDTSPYPINLWKAIFNCDGEYFNYQYSFICKKFDEVLDSLTPREEAILKSFYSNHFSISDILRLLDLPNTETIREVFKGKYIDKSLRKLRHPSRSKKLCDLIFYYEQGTNKISDLSWHWSDILLNSIETEKICSFTEFDYILSTYISEKTCFNTKLLLVEFLNQGNITWKLFSVDLFGNYIIVNDFKEDSIIFKNIVEKIEEEIAIKPYQLLNSTTLIDMDLSVRSFNCLTRAGINTLEDILSRSIEDLMLVRNLGRKGLEETLYKLKSYGYHTNEDGNFEYTHPTASRFNNATHYAKYYLKLYCLNNIKYEEHLIKGFFDNSSLFGYSKDGADWFIEMFENNKFNLNDPSIIDKINNSQLLGSLILKKWRHITHWTSQSLLSFENRIWFIVAFTRLYQIEAESQKNG